MQTDAHHRIYEDNDAPSPMRTGEDKTPIEIVPGEVKIMGAGTAIGGAWGASMAMSASAVPAGVAASGGWVTVGAAAGTGIAASGVLGYGIGSIIGEFEPIKNALSSLLEWGLKEPGGHQHMPGEMDGCLKPNGDKDGTWEFNFNPSDVTLESQAWFYIGDGTGSMASFEADWNDGGIEVYSDPFAALEVAQAMGLAGVMDELYLIYEMR
jgi:hypothetical protein